MTTIAQERTLRAGVGLILRTREQASLRFDYTNSRPVIEPAVADYNHISVTNPRNYASNDAHWRGIESIGIARFGATGISYNGGVLPGAVLYEGQPWGRRGAHTVNTYERANCATTGCPSRGSSIWAPSWNNNVNGRALVFARNVNDAVTDADVDAAGRYWAGHKLCGLLRRDARLHGHRCCSAKDCPGNRVWVRMDDINDLTATYVRTGLPGAEEDDVNAEEVWEGYRVTSGPQAGDAPITVLAEASTYARMAEFGVVALSGKVDKLLARPAVDVNALAAAIVDKLPEGTLDLAVVKQGVREVLLEGVASLA